MVESVFQNQGRQSSASEEYLVHVAQRVSMSRNMWLNLHLNGPSPASPHFCKKSPQNKDKELLTAQKKQKFKSVIYVIHIVKHKDIQSLLLIFFQVLRLKVLKNLGMFPYFCWCSPVRLLAWNSPKTCNFILTQLWVADCALATDRHQANDLGRTLLPQSIKLDSIKPHKMSPKKKREKNNIKHFKKMATTWSRKLANVGSTSSSLAWDIGCELPLQSWHLFLFSLSSLQLKMYIKSWWPLSLRHTHKQQIAHFLFGPNHHITYPTNNWNVSSC